MFRTLPLGSIVWVGASSWSESRHSEVELHLGVFMTAIPRALLPLPGEGREETAIKVKQKHENLLRPRDWLSPTGRPGYLNGPVRDQNLNLFPVPPLIWHHRDKPELPRYVMTFLKLFSPLSSLVMSSISNALASIGPFLTQLLLPIQIIFITFNY